MISEIIAAISSEIIGAMISEIIAIMKKDYPKFPFNERNIDLYGYKIYRAHSFA